MSIADTYSGRIIVCGARYVPVAGHRSTRKAVQEMADNKRLEVWLAEVVLPHLSVAVQVRVTKLFCGQVPAVVIPGLRKSYCRRGDVERLLEQHTYGNDQVPV